MQIECNVVISTPTGGAGAAPNGAGAPNKPFRQLVLVHRINHSTAVLVHFAFSIITFLISSSLSSTTVKHCNRHHHHPPHHHRHQQPDRHRHHCQRHYQNLQNCHHGRYICGIYHFYVVIFNRCDTIPAYHYLAKHVCLMMVFISQMYP